MKGLWSIIVAVLFLALTAGCGPSQAPEPRAVPEAPAPATATATTAVFGSRQLVRSADLAVAVDDTEAAAQEIRRLAGSLGGYVASFSARRQENILHYSMSLRVPSARLDAAVEALKRLASSVDRESLRTEDVTDQAIDLDARLRALTITEAELLSLLTESRRNNRGAEDIMAVYRELTEIRSKLEHIQGQRKNLEGRVSLATLNVELRPTQSARPLSVGRWRPADTARASGRALAHVLRVLLDVCIFGLIVLLPVAVLLGVPVWGLRRLWRRAKSSGPPAAS